MKSSLLKIIFKLDGVKMGKKTSLSSEKWAQIVNLKQVKKAS